MRLVELDNYNIHIGPIQETFSKAVDLKKYSSVFVLVDEHTADLCLPNLIPVLDKYHIIKIASGELNKSIEVGSFIWRSFIREQADRKALLINLGGGVIGDMGGFCASTYKRGIDFIQIPTTLLSQVDASIGGKLAIDFDQIKNCVGLFNDPACILIDPEYLHSVPKEQLVSGMTEILKHGLLGDNSILDRLYKMEDLSELINLDLIADAINIKKEVVEKDPFENGLRKVLNLGHTIGHAIESYYLDTDDPLSHGEAIAAGLVCELYISHHLHGMDERILIDVERFVQKWYRDFNIPSGSYSQLFHLLLNDKKNEFGKIYFSLMKGIGDPLINQVVSKEWVIRSFDFYNEKVVSRSE